MKQPATDPSAFVETKVEMTVSGSVMGDMLKTVLHQRLSFRFRAAGTSMSPFIKNGDVLTISPLGNTPPTFGGVIACIHPHTKKTVVHRLVGRPHRRFLVKGDNSHAPGVLLNLNDILGHVTRIERSGRRIRLGLGPERRLIALFSRRGILQLSLSFLQRLLRHLERDPQYE